MARIKRIQIKNYRSIEDLIIEINPCQDGSWTYGLIGVNEAGKSSILKALALKELLIEITQKDFRGNNPIEIIYTLVANDIEKQQYIEIANQSDPIISLKDVTFDDIECKIWIDNSNLGTINFEVSIAKTETDDVDRLGKALRTAIFDSIPKAVFWTAEPRYLIDKPITQSSFAASPESVSIPLKNCFTLAGITNISEYIRGMTGTPDEEHLENLLGEKVTEHIRIVWPNHPIQVTFRIASDMINFHVKDEGVKGKAKTADQRSDGFKQFISFLLTVSAQNKNEELSNTILLLDEPETHLHPQAQEHLLSELIKISRNNKNNVCFFATHSLFMIDKNDIGRNYKTSKENDKTIVESFANKSSSYSRVAYEVYDIVTSDFHNELYGRLQEREGKFKESDFNDYLKEQGIESNVPYIKLKPDNTTEKYPVTLPVKIRNIIHHPENKNNNYTKDELNQSIIALLKLS